MPNQDQQAEFTGLGISNRRTKLEDLAGFESVHPYAACCKHVTEQIKRTKSTDHPKRLVQEKASLPSASHSLRLPSSHNPHPPGSRQTAEIPEAKPSDASNTYKGVDCEGYFPYIINPNKNVGNVLVVNRAFRRSGPFRGGIRFRAGLAMYGASVLLTIGPQKALVDKIVSATCHHAIPKKELPFNRQSFAHAFMSGK